MTKQTLLSYWKYTFSFQRFIGMGWVNAVHLQNSTRQCRKINHSFRICFFLFFRIFIICKPSSCSKLKCVMLMRKLIIHIFFMIQLTLTNMEFIQTQVVSIMHEKICQKLVIKLIVCIAISRIHPSMWMCTSVWQTAKKKQTIFSWGPFWNLPLTFPVGIFLDNLKKKEEEKHQDVIHLYYNLYPLFITQTKVNEYFFLVYFVHTIFLNFRLLFIDYMMNDV